MRDFRKYVLALTVLPLILSSCEEDIVSEKQKVYASETFSIGFEVKSRARFQLTTVNGSVEITGDPDATAVTVTGVKKVGSSSMDDASDHLDSLSVAIDSSETQIILRTSQPQVADGRDYIIDYKVTLPDGFDVLVGGANGDLNLSDLRGRLTVGYANATIYGSEIECSTRMSVGNGRIETTVALPAGGQIALSAANGQIHLKIPTDTSARLQASVAAGDITTKYLTLTDEERTPTSLTGTLGDGDGSINLNVANGWILVEGVLTETGKGNE